MKQGLQHKEDDGQLERFDRVLANPMIRIGLMHDLLTGRVRVKTSPAA